MGATTSDPAAPPGTTWWARLLPPLLGLAGIALLLSASMARVVTFDEDQYLAAGLMVSQGRLPYRDFVFLQAPLHPLLLGAVFKLAGTWFVLAGRLLTFVLSVASGALLWFLVRRLGANRTLSCVLVAACLASPFLATPLASARNDAPALALFLGGLLLYFRVVDGSFAGRVAAALLLGLAAEAKLTYLFGPAGLLLHALVWPRRRLLPVLLGSALAAAPMAWLLWQSGLEPVRFGLLDWYATAPAAWAMAQGLEDQLLLPVRLQMFMGWLFGGGNLTLLVLSAALAMITVARKRKWKRPGQLLVALLVGAVVLDFMPAPSWAMYFAPVAPLLACCIAHLDRITTFLADPARKRVLVLVAALPVVPPLLTQGPEVLRFARGEWVGLEAHRTALAVRDLVATGGPVATLFPHLVMDANPVPAAFAAGPYVFRSGALFAPALLERLHAVAPSTLAASFEREPPAAILTGAYASVFRTPMDQALTDYASAHGWRVAGTLPGAGSLWVPPGR